MVNRNIQRFLILQKNATDYKLKKYSLVNTNNDKKKKIPYGVIISHFKKSSDEICRLLVFPVKKTQISASIKQGDSGQKLLNIV